MKHLTETIWCHWQNLTDSWGKRELRRGFWHGRAWLHGERSNIRFSWAHGKDAQFTRFMLELAGGDTGRELTLGIGLWHLFSYFLTFDFPWFEQWMPGKMVQSSRDGRWFKVPVERQIGIRIFDWKIWFSLWDNPNEWNIGDPKWWAFNLNIRDLLLGVERRSYSDILDAGDTTLIMPEASYRADYIKRRTVYKRPRWFSREVFTVDIDLPVPVPVPGKGENAWDCGDDAICATSISTQSLDDALQRVRESAMKDRERYGGPDWVASGMPVQAG